MSGIYEYIYYKGMLWRCLTCFKSMGIRYLRMKLSAPLFAVFTLWVCLCKTYPKIVIKILFFPFSTVPSYNMSRMEHRTILYTQFSLGIQNGYTIWVKTEVYI